MFENTFKISKSEKVQLLILIISRTLSNSNNKRRILEIYIVVFIIGQLHSTPAKQHIISLLSQHCLIPSQSAKTYDSLAVKSIFALLLEEVTRPKQAHSEGRNALKK